MLYCLHPIDGACASCLKLKGRKKERAIRGRAEEETDICVSVKDGVSEALHYETASSEMASQSPKEELRTRLQAARWKVDTLQ